PSNGETCSSANTRKSGMPSVSSPTFTVTLEAVEIPTLTPAPAPMWVAVSPPWERPGRSAHSFAMLVPPEAPGSGMNHWGGEPLSDTCTQGLLLEISNASGLPDPE